MALRPNAGHSLLILEVSRSHTTTHHSRQDSSGRVISSSQRLLPDNTNTHNRHTSMPPLGFEPTISAGERPQTYALDRAATGTGFQLILLKLNSNKASLSTCEQQFLSILYVVPATCAVGKAKLFHSVAL